MNGFIEVIVDADSIVSSALFLSCFVAIREPKRYIRGLVSYVLFMPGRKYISPLPAKPVWEGEEIRQRKSPPGMALHGRPALPGSRGLHAVKIDDPLGGCGFHPIHLAGDQS